MMSPFGSSEVGEVKFSRNRMNGGGLRYTWHPWIRKLVQKLLNPRVFYSVEFCKNRAAFLQVESSKSAWRLHRTIPIREDLPFSQIELVEFAEIVHLCLYYVSRVAGGEIKRSSSCLIREALMPWFPLSRFINRRETSPFSITSHFISTRNARLQNYKRLCNWKRTKDTEKLDKMKVIRKIKDSVSKWERREMSENII